MENEINIEIDETPKTKPFNVYKLKIALNIIFVILGALLQKQKKIIHLMN